MLFLISRGILVLLLGLGVVCNGINMYRNRKERKSPLNECGKPTYVNPWKGKLWYTVVDLLGWVAFFVLIFLDFKGW